MTQPTIVKKTSLICSMKPNTIGGAFSPTFASASPNSTAKNSTCSMLFCANAEMADAGMIPRRNSTVCGSSPLAVFWAMASAPVASVCGSMSKPAPGRTRLPTTSPNSSANVVMASNQISALIPMRPTELRSPTCAMPITTVQNTIGAITILMSVMKASAIGLRAAPKSGAVQPTTMPATIATSSWKYSER